jgi:hypothetical protein
LFPRIRTTTIFPATNTEITTEDFLKLLLKAKKIELKTKNAFLSMSVLVLIECLIIKKYYIAAKNDVTAIGLCSC